MSKIPPTLCPDFTLKRCNTDQNFFCKFCCPNKNRGPHFFSFLICAFAYGPLRSYVKSLFKIWEKAAMYNRALTDLPSCQIIISSSQVDFGSQEGPVMEEKSGHEFGVFMPIKKLFKDRHVTIALVVCLGGKSTVICLQSETLT